METISEIAKISFYGIAIIGTVLFLFRQPGLKKKTEITVESLNEKFYERAKRLLPDLRGVSKKSLVYEELDKKAYLLEFNGSIMADEVSSLQEEIDTIFLIGQKGEEVILKLESPGGAAPHYSYAASQLERLKKRGFKLTVCIDRVAASGGYMMAAVGDKILASKDAIVGSIGVVAEFPNFAGTLNKLGVTWKEYTAGDHKRSVGTFKIPTEEDEEHFKQKLVTVHKSFKEHIKLHRPEVDENKVMDGDHWLAREAVELKLVDQISTSDEYIWETMKTAEVFKIKYAPRESLYSKIFKEAEAMMGRLVIKVLSHKNRYY